MIYQIKITNRLEVDTQPDKDGDMEFCYEYNDREFDFYLDAPARLKLENLLRSIRYLEQARA